jgi:hypothetical protein
MKKDVKFYYVYIITNTISNKQYVGSRMCYKDNIELDDYMGSSKYLKEDYKIFGKDKFIKHILKKDYLNIKDMLAGEIDYILKYNTLAPNGYNHYISKVYPNYYMHGCKHSEEAKNKIGQKSIGRHVGRKQSPETIAKRTLANTGKKRTQETKDKTRNSLLGIKHTEERKRHISEAHKGKSFFAKNFGPPKRGADNPMYKHVSPDDLHQITKLHTEQRLSPKKIAPILNNKYCWAKILKVLRNENAYIKTI